ncbi:MAG: hypothetical protein JNJ58_12245 [Chitinophagaceae bacterium]|nr:hypothetical protein [Chitinophagaceae bacterium]
MKHQPFRLYRVIGLFLLSLLLMMEQVDATIRRVCNLPIGIAPYSSAQAAVNDAANGDTILIYGTAKEYDAIMIADKRVVLIGPGISPQGSNKLTAKLSSLTIQNSLANGAPDYSEFHGLELTSGFFVMGSVITQHLLFNSCYVKSNCLMNPGTNWTYIGYRFTNNYFSNATISFSSTPANTTSVDSFIFFNNVVRLISGNFFKQFYQGWERIIQHNLFYAPSFQVPIFESGTCRFFMLKDNIFSQNSDFENGDQVTYFNNLTFNCDNNSPWLLTGHVDSGGNLSNISPLLGSQAQVISTLQNPALNFEPQSGSPALGVSSDGKNIGVLFESFPDPNYRRGLNGVLSYIVQTQPLGEANPGGTIPLRIQANHIKR